LGFHARFVRQIPGLQIRLKAGIWNIPDYRNIEVATENLPKSYTKSHGTYGGGSGSLAFLCKPGEPPEVAQYRGNRGVKTAGSFPPIFARNAVMLIFIECIGCLLGKKHHFCGRKSLARRADDVALGLNAAISRTSST
jgi:hypothetical protein